MSRFVDTYRRVESRRATDETSYVYAFALLLGITIVAAAGVSVLFARSVSLRLAELASATHRVGAGDLTIRVPERGRDEIAELARAFNRMVREVEASRARIEYLQRIGAWQEMARRLAHEIKNPLTPIQLAIQELHSRYRGEDPVFADLVDSTLEIVEDEVRTLRRLVSEFSEFARLPRAELVPADLGSFLLEQCERLQQMRDWPKPVDQKGAEDEWPSLILTCRLDVSTAPVRMDRQMFRRVLVNLIQNAVEAAREGGRASVRVDVQLTRKGDNWVVDIDDDGPGVDSVMQDVMFDPYFTTKHSGTGLGLAIVKKAVVEHGGSIEVGVSVLGGALFRIRLPSAEHVPVVQGRAGVRASRARGGRRGVDSAADA
jgi:nitrogen fixation/metabolism regulation signal transduction histidine kinase